MPTTDREQDLREALAAILDANVALQAVLGRSAGLAIERNAITVDTPLPIVAVDVVRWDEHAGVFDLQLTGCAKDGKTARLAVRAAVDALNWAAFNAHGMQIIPTGTVRRSVEQDPERSLPIGLRLQLEDFHEADADLTLLDTD